MNDKIVNVIFLKCGTCRFWQKPDNRNLADCFGMPPTPFVLGGQQDALGRPVLNVEIISPRVHRDRAACSRHDPKEDFATLGRS